MDCTKQYTVRVTEGNAFALILPLKSRHYISTKPIDSDIDILILQNVVVKVGGVVWDDVTLTTQGVSIAIPATQAVGTYNVELTALYNNIAIRAAYFECFTIVPWSYQSDVQNFIPDSPITAEAAFIVAGNWTNEELDALTQELQQAIADNRAAQADAEAAKDEFVQKAAMLDNVAQQGSNPGATLTDTQAAVEALAPVAQAAEAYAEGKPALAQAITSKGVQTASTDSLAQMAANVQQISQDTYEIDGGELYAKQLYGSLTTPNYWNLYEVLESLLSDGRFVNYGGILLAEYYKGYDTLVLSGAGAGGGYVTSDGQFYTEDTTHTWNDDFDGKGNRWVAYLFATAGHSFTISNTNTSPRSIFIGRHVGVIESLVDGRVGEIVVPDGNSLAAFVTGTFIQNFGKNITLRNLGDLTGTAIYLPSDAIAKIVENIYISANKKTGSTILIHEPVNGASQTHNVILDFTNQGEDKLEYVMDVGTSSSLKNVYVNTFIIKGAKSIGQFILKSAKSLGNIILEDAEKITTSNYEGIFPFCEFNKVWLPSLEEANKNGNLIYGGTPCKYLYIGYKTNDRTKTVALKNGTDYSEFTDIELKDGYMKNLDIAGLTSYLTESNIVNHILNRLGDNSNQSPLTITLGATNLAKLTAEEIAIATNKGFTLA